MPHFLIHFGPITLPTYTFMIGMGICSSMGFAVIRYRLRQTVSSGAVMDVCLAGLAGALVLARAAHVALNWTYFSLHPQEILQIQAGGLNWHGAVIGASLVMWLVAAIRGIRLPLLLDMLAPALPTIAFMAWWGCGASHCSYGAEVENLSYYPSFLVWEERDIFNIIAPRYATQPLGMAVSLALLLIVIFLGRLFTPGTGRRFWLALMLLSAGMFWLDSMRGDYAVIVAGLRLDQWLDLGMLLFSGAFTLRLSGNPAASQYSQAGQP